MTDPALTYYEPLLRRARRLAFETIQDRSVTPEDLVQGAYLRYYRATPEIVDEDHLQGYLHQALTSEARDIRKHKMRSPVGITTPIPTGDPNDNCPACLELEHLIDQAARHRGLRYLLLRAAGVAVAEIAASEDSTASAIKAQMNKWRTASGHNQPGLTPEAVRAIRALFATGLSNVEIGQQFGRRPNTISDIRRGRTHTLVA